jgi:PAS domain S-box-containing protein
VKPFITTLFASPATRPRWQRVAAALLPVLCWAILYVWFGQHDVDHPFTLMMMPVMMAAVLGGLQSGLAATLLGLVGAWDLATVTSPALSLKGLDGLDLAAGAVFALTGAMITLTVHFTRVHAEQLLASNALIARTAAAAQVGHWEFQIKTGRVTWSPQLLDFRGIAERAFDGTLAAAIACTHPDDRERFAATARDARVGEPYTTEFRVVRPDGQIRWLEARGQLFVDDAGQPDHFSGTELDITARKMAESNLQQVVDASPAVIYTCRFGGDWGATFVSAKVNKLLGYTSAECLQPGWWVGTLHPEDRERVLAGLADLSTHGHHVHEYRMLSKSGQFRWVQDELAVIYNAHGEPTHCTGAILDITERKAAEAALSQFKTTLDATHDCVFMFHPDTLQFFYVNQGARDQVGYTEAELLAMHPYDIKPQFPEPQFRAMIAPLLDGRKPSARFETLHRHKDGHDVPVEVFLQYIAPAGEPPRFVNIVTDITERKAAESARALATANTELSTALDAAELGTMVVDLAGETTVWNTRMFEIFGTPEDQRHNPVPKPTYLNRVPREDHPLIEAALASTLALGQAQCSHRLLWPDGSTRQVVDTLRLQRTSDGTPAQLLIVVRDVTAEHEAEQALAQALVAAQAGDKAKSEFLSVISHEIRTPLNGVMGMLQLVQLQSDLGQQTRAYVDESYQSSQLLLTILNDVLDFSGLQKGRLSVSPAPMRVSQLTRYLQQLQSSLVFRHGVVFQALGHKGADVVVAADELRLKQMLLNLVNNAVKFTESGSIKAAVELTSADAQQVKLELLVQDSGIGMSEQTQAQLFTPFMQADMSMTRRYGGTGLGLAIVKQLVDEMGGHITVHSRLGMGSTFTIALSLPVLADKAVQEAAPADTLALALRANEEARLLALMRSTERASQAPAQIIPAKPQEPKEPEPAAPAGLDSDQGRQQVLGALKGVHVLIVEDSVPNARVEAAMLQAAGAQATLAHDAFEALQIMAEPPEPIDVVLMDLQMPHMDGFEATRILRNSDQPRLRDLPVIGLSGNIMRGEPEQAIEAGMNHFLAKPASLESMVQAIRQVLGAR